MHSLHEQNDLDCIMASGSDAALVVQVHGDFNQSNADGNFLGFPAAWPSGAEMALFLTWVTPGPVKPSSVAGGCRMGSGAAWWA